MASTPKFIFFISTIVLNFFTQVCFCICCCILFVFLTLIMNRKRVKMGHFWKNTSQIPVLIVSKINFTMQCVSDTILYGTGTIFVVLNFSGRMHGVQCSVARYEIFIWKSIRKYWCLAPLWLHFFLKFMQLRVFKCNCFWFSVFCCEISNYFFCGYNQVCYC